MPDNLVGIAACASNALELDYHLEEFVKWHAPKVDQIVINVDSNSTDDTYPVLQYFKKYINNLEVFVTDWGERTAKDWLGKAKLEAFRKLNTRWRILLDIDEFLFRWDNDAVDIKARIDRLNPSQLHAILYHHFIGSYKTIGTTSQWPAMQWRIACTDDPEIYRHIYTDPSGSNLVGVEPNQYPSLEILHFGCVRKRELLLKKWQEQMQRNYGIDSIATNSWLSSAEDTISILTTGNAGLELPLFFQTPEFERDNFEVYNQCVS